MYQEWLKKYEEIKQISKADEMFDELGYEKKHDNKRRIVYKRYFAEIEFDIRVKLIDVNIKLNMQELQAINE